MVPNGGGCADWAGSKFRKEAHSDDCHFISRVTKPVSPFISRLLLIPQRSSSWYIQPCYTPWNISFPKGWYSHRNESFLQWFVLDEQFSSSMFFLCCHWHEAVTLWNICSGTFVRSRFALSDEHEGSLDMLQCAKFFILPGWKWCPCMMRWVVFD